MMNIVAPEVTQKPNYLIDDIIVITTSSRQTTYRHQCPPNLLNQIKIAIHNVRAHTGTISIETMDT